MTKVEVSQLIDAAKKDDGDAIRLAIKLELNIRFVEELDCFWVEVSLPPHSDYELSDNIRIFDSVAREDVSFCLRQAISLAAEAIFRDE